MERPHREPRLSLSNVGIRDPQVDVVHEGYTVLVTRLAGTLGEDVAEGLFDFDTRLVSWWRLTLDGRPPAFVSTLGARGGRWGGLLRVQREGGDDQGPLLKQDAIEVELRRCVGHGMEERIVLRNRSMAPLEARLALELAASFDDIVEPPTADAPQPGTTTATWDADARELRFDHLDAEDELRLHRALRVTIDPPAALRDLEAVPAAPSRPQPLPPGFAEHGCRVDACLDLRPGEAAELVLRYASLVDEAWREPVRDAPAGDAAAGSTHERWIDDELRHGTAVRSASAVLDQVVDVARRDLLELRNRDLAGDADDSWLLNAGVPQFTGVFGRDTLITGLQALLFGPAPLHGALRWTADTQGRERDDATEEQPGRMLHELRRSPASDLRRVPQHRFYGAHTTSTLFGWALAEHWLWTGDLAAVERWLPAAERALEWAARDGDADGDGFLEYRPRSPDGLKNEAWKDSAEAIRYPDGHRVDNPIATVEEQAFHLGALASVAALLVAVGRAGDAAPLHERARRLRRRWHEAYWAEDLGWYALALDPDRRPVRTIASNPAHGLLAAAIPPSVAPRVADRLLAPDLFSGWGVRTLAAGHPSFNPLSYHLGSVWPFENAMFVAGLRAYGLDDHAERLADAQLSAAGFFRDARLPELFGGHPADELGVPTVYADSNTTQAWTASAMAMILQALLGLRPLAPVGALVLVRPRLPAWLPWLELSRVRVGDATASIRFDRAADGTTRHTLLATDGALRVVRTDARPGEGGPGAELRPLLDELAADADAPADVVDALRARLAGAGGWTDG